MSPEGSSLPRLMREPVLSRSSAVESEALLLPKNALGDE